MRLEVVDLDQNKSLAKCGEGRLPASAPLANPYVPFQNENPMKYEARKAMVRGTLFPGLDLPFMGMVNKQEAPVTPLTELQTMAFVIQELALYLDTHPEDLDAVQMYTQYQRLYNEGRDAYEKMCGPLNHMSVSEGRYRWLEEPWPWEYAKNQEV